MTTTPTKRAPRASAKTKAQAADAGPLPFVDLTRLEPGFLEAWQERVADIGRRAAFVGGDWTERLEERLAREAGVAHAVGCANGTDALQLALRALGVGPGDTVLLPDLTFWATLEAVANVGAKAVAVEVSATDLQLDLEAFKTAALEHKPKAAILVHLYGWATADLAPLRLWCGARGIPLLEDGAQAWGVQHLEKPLPARAQISTVSFYPSKVLGACGDAGAVLTNDAALAEAVRRLGNHGRAGHDNHEVLGFNSRLGGLEAAWLDLCLDHLPARLASRRAAAARYRAALGDLPGWRMVGPPEAVTENGYLSVTLVEAKRRHALVAALAAAGIATGRVYPRVVSAQPGAGPALKQPADNPIARRITKGIINLPLFAHLREEEVERVIAAVRGLRHASPSAAGDGA